MTALISGSVLAVVEILAEDADARAVEAVAIEELGVVDRGAIGSRAR